MAKLGEIRVADGSDTKSGIAFRLKEDSPVEEDIELKDGWAVSLQLFGSYVVANSSKDLSREEILQQGYEKIQEALDILSVEGEANLVCRDTNRERLIWWSKNNSQYLRIVGIGGTIFETVVDNEEEKNQDYPDWNEAMRYFRISQMTDSLFVSYRNMYLAFENLISEITPKKGKREIEWIKQSLQNLPCNVDFSDYTVSESDEIKKFIEEQYISVRCNIFHAKDDKPRSLPQDEEERKTVKKALDKLAKFVIFLMKEELGIHRSDDIVTYEQVDKWRNWFKEEENLKMRFSGVPTSFNLKYVEDTEENLDAVLGETEIGKIEAIRESILFYEGENEDKEIFLNALNEPLWFDNTSYIQLEEVDFLQFYVGIPKNSQTPARTRFRH